MRNKNARVPDPNKIFSCSGDKFHTEYATKVNDDGTIELVESGKTNIQEFIQSFKDQTDMSYILKQLALGDVSVLNQKRPIYGDFTEAPKTMAEFYQRQIDGQRAFNALPVEIRNQYDHNVNKFMADIGSEKWNSLIKDYIPNNDGAAAPTADTVKEDVNVDA